MNKRVSWTDPARADLRAINQVDAPRILNAIARYLASNEGDVKHLINTNPPELRLRYGNYRVRFRDTGDSMVVLAVKHRKDAYR